MNTAPIVDPVAEFRRAMAESGLATADPIVADGKLHRVRIEGERQRNGWYVLHGDGRPAGRFGCWKRGIDGKWSAERDVRATAADRAEWDRIRRAREAAERELHERTARKAERIWGAAEPADPDHPYLRRKGIRPHGIRQSGNRLIVRVRDGGALRGLQYISEDGSKKFLTGTSKRGAYHSFGRAGERIVVAEGVATAITIHEATGLGVVVAFDAGNLLPVVRKIRAKYPDAHIVIAADNDAGTPGNPGLTAAEAAARAVGGEVIAPEFGELEEGSDWNDVARNRGMEEVEVAFGEAGSAAQDTEEEAETPVFATLAELMERPELLQPPECVLPRIGFRGRLVIVAGPDKAGKSTLLSHGITSVSRRSHFLGDPVSTRHGRAVLMGLEEALGDAVRRLADIGAHGHAVQLVVMTPPDLLQRTKALLTDWPADLLVLDSLTEYARLTQGTVPDDGDSAGWSAVVRPLVALAREHDVAVVVLHHVRRSDGEYRGSSEIAAAADAMIEIRRPSSGEDPNVRHLKGRGRWPIDDFSVALRDGRYELSGGAELSLDAQVLLFVEQNRGASRTAVREAIKARASTVDASINNLLARGALENRGTRDRLALYPPSGQTTMEAA